MSADLLISTAIMLWIFLLQLSNSIGGLSGAEHDTLCTSNACFTLHMDRLRFVNASENCAHNGGYLMTIRNREEEDVLRSLLSKIQRQRHDEELRFWIGLKLNKQKCVLPEKPLKGFQWVSGEDSHYSNWREEPVFTCMKERCVSVHYTSLHQNQLKWFDGPCKGPAFYVCKFYFKGMCKPLALRGPGEITYMAPFSEKPQSTEMKSFPMGTYALISCGDRHLPYSVCTDVDGIYQWTAPGPFCKTENQNCNVNNGGCQHLCHEDAGEVRCLCRKGYDLDEDGVSCRIKDLCGADTCEYQCVMSESGYSCKCPHGFKLDENQRSCSDIDECQSSQACEDHLCVNTPGSYTCKCNEGYEMIHGKCSDVDECAQSRCEHKCSNNMGSFSCYCNEGFTLSPDGHSCVDVNECVSSSCQFTCVNTPGSFWCACPRGFHLGDDGSSCAPSATETPAAPPDDRADEDPPEDFTESLTRTTVELQHQSPHTDPPSITHRNHVSNTSLSTGPVNPVNSRVIICVLGSVIPLLALLAVTLAIAIFRCSRSKKEAKKNTTTDGYCWVSPGLDPRLEKLYESILTDDL